METVAAVHGPTAWEGADPWKHPRNVRIPVAIATRNRAVNIAVPIARVRPRRPIYFATAAIRNAAGTEPCPKRASLQFEVGRLVPAKPRMVLANPGQRDIQSPNGP